MKFATTTTQVATRDLTVAVNAAVTLQRTLPVKGEPGIGKTILPRLLGASLKNEQDVHLFERLAFMARSGRWILPIWIAAQIWRIGRNCLGLATVLPQWYHVLQIF